LDSFLGINPHFSPGGPRLEVRELVGVGVGIGIEWRRAWRLGMSNWTSTTQQGCPIMEEPTEYRTEAVDTDADTDSE